MAHSTAGGSLASIYKDRIGSGTNDNEVTGYWLFIAGLCLGVLGLFVYLMTDAATMWRSVGYAWIALAPPFIMTGAVLQFPLRKMATYLAGVGLLITFGANEWFIIIFPGGWSTSAGNVGVIMTYVAGLAIIGIAGSIVPLATDRRDAALSAAEQRAATAETAGEDAAAASQEAERAGKVREEALAAEIVGLEGDNADLRSSKAEFELYTDAGDEWRWRLVHDNGNIIADSGESYSSKSMAQKGLGSVKLNALGGVINEI